MESQRKSTLIIILGFIFSLGLNLFLIEFGEEEAVQVFYETALAVPYQEDSVDSSYHDLISMKKVPQVSLGLMSSFVDEVQQTSPDNYTPEKNTEQVKPTPKKEKVEPEVKPEKVEEKRNEPQLKSSEVSSKPVEFEDREEASIEEKTVLIEETDTEESEEEEDIDIYDTLDPEDESELFRSNPLGSLVRKMGIKATAEEREQALLKIYQDHHHQEQDLIAFLRCKDQVMIVNVAKALGFLNTRDAFLPITQRIEHESSEQVLKGLYEALGMLTYEEASFYLNDAFHKESNRQVLRSIAKGLKYRVDVESKNKLQILLENEKVDLLKAEWLLLWVTFDPWDRAFSFAKSKIDTDNTLLRMLCIEILSYSKEPNDFQFLQEKRRLMYKSIELMEAFAQAKLKLGTLNLAGEERLYKMEKMSESNDRTLSWLALYIAESLPDEKSWLRRFLKRHPNINNLNFLRAVILLDLELRPIIQKARKKEGGAKGGDPSLSEFSPDYEEDIESLRGKVIFEKTLPKDIRLFWNNKLVTKVNSFFSSIKPGKYALKVEKETSTEKVSVSVKPKHTTYITIEEVPPPPKIINSLGIEMVLIKPGEFLMGENDLGHKEHMVRITNPFYLAAYETTNAIYEKFDPDHHSERDNRSDQDNQPVVLVSWDEAVAFCNWLSGEEGYTKCYDQFDQFDIFLNGYRLPTEAEWEYAARGGLQGNKYPWGNRFKWDGSYFANFKDSGDEDDGYVFTAPVGSFAENRYGLYDMAGNVSEWVSDWYQDNYYDFFERDEVTVDPIGPNDGSSKVTRGGSWYAREALQCGSRVGAHVAGKVNYIGFRIARRAFPTIKIKVKAPVEDVEEEEKEEIKTLEVDPEKDWI